MNERGDLPTRDNTEPVTEEQFHEGMWISVAVGFYYTLNAFIPIIAWYGWRKTDILAMTNNSLYKFAWYTLYPLHWLVFTPMALLWPFTYIGSATIVEFYDLANWWLGSVTGGVVYALVALTWLLAALFYD